MGAPGNVAVVSTTFVEGGFTFPAKSGKQWLDLTGSTSTATGVSQTVATVAHTPYTLTFAIGNIVNPGGMYGTTSTVNVVINGAVLMTAVSSKGTGSTAMVWKTFSLTFIASESSTTIGFINVDPPATPSTAWTR